MRTLSISAVVTINLLIGVRYVWLLRKHRISPALAMWVFFTIATVGSLLTYLGEGRFSPLDNILNTADILLVAGVTVAILSVRGSKHALHPLRPRVPEPRASSCGFPVPRYQGHEKGLGSTSALVST